MSCEGCPQACCRLQVAPPFDWSIEADRDRVGGLTIGELCDALRIELRHTIPGGGLTPPCSWLDEDTGLCRHYDIRPQVCRDRESDRGNLGSRCDADNEVLELRSRG